MHLLISALLAVTLLAVPLAAQQLPTGFVDELVNGGFFQPTSFAFLPDGRRVVTEQTSGRVMVATNTAAGVAGIVPGIATNHQEQGLLGIAVDPAWPTWPYIYVIYNHAQPASVRILRYTAVGALTDPTSTGLSLTAPYWILTDPPDTSPLHNGGTLRFGPDGMLYASLGDDQAGCSAQNPESLSGKILRMDVSAVHGVSGAGPPLRGTIAAPGNPWSGPYSQLVWALGLRNPFRFQIDPLTGNLVIGDVGSSTWEELDVAVGPAANFGWPLFEGPAPSSPCTGAPGTLSPATDFYPNTLPSAIVSLGGVYRNVPSLPHALGAAYDGSLFYADFFVGGLQRMVSSGGMWTRAGAVPGQPHPTFWGTGYSAVSDALQGPDGALWYVKWAPGSIRRIRPQGASRQLAIHAGQNQWGNAGWPLFHPLEVLVSDLAGNPLAGVPVAFSVLSGGGLPDPQPVFSDASGVAGSGFTLPVATNTNPILVQAATPGAPPVFFNVRWRGLEAGYDPLQGNLTVTVTHSRVGAPLSFLVQAPPPALLGTVFGDVVINLANPGPGVFGLDGLGMIGPPDPSAAFPATMPVWTLFLPGLNVPPGGILLLAQAFSIDATLYPDPAGVLVTNPVWLNLF